MRTPFLSLATASVLLAGVGFASAQTTTTTTTTWSNQDGAMIRQYSETQHYAPVTDPSLNVGVGVELPSTVTVYPLPQTVTVENPDQYSYTIINNHPVVIERSTRKIIQQW